MKVTLGRMIGFAALVVLAVVVGGALFEPSPGGDGAEAAATVSDPSADWVTVDTQGSLGIYKSCDGSTLIYIATSYHGTGIAVVANSPECPPSAIPAPSGTPQASA